MITNLPTSCNIGSYDYDSIDEKDPLLQPSTPPPSYNTIIKSDPVPPTYQQITRPQYDRVLGPPSTPPTNEPKQYTSLAAIVFFCCCCCSPFSCIALYYSARVQEHLRNGDITNARKASKKTRCFATLALIVGLLTLFVVVIASFALCEHFDECSNTLKIKIKHVHI